MPKYSVIETVLVENPDFNNLELLTEKIKNRAIQISDEITDYLKTIN
jgi:hypothetical protein